MYAQSFFVTSVRGKAFPPITSERGSDGVSGFMNAAFGLRFAVAFFFVAGLLARFFAGMHLSFRVRSPIRYIVGAGWITTTLLGGEQELQGKSEGPEGKK